MLRTIFIMFGIYILYQLIFRFIIPIYRATSQVRKQFTAAQQHMQEQARQNNAAAAAAQAGPTVQKTAKKDDYIDFEEVR